MSKFKDLTGQTFDRLKVRGIYQRNTGKGVIWDCLCSCGNTTYVVGSNLRKGGTRSCGCLKAEVRRESLKPSEKAGWVGKAVKTGQGYSARKSWGHPRAHKNGYVLEHILVMEKRLGRFLLPGETVHHINGLRRDNRPENLELWVKPQPSGIKVEDAVAWAKEILRRYDKNDV